MNGTQRSAPCARCGATDNPAGANFCSGCGAELRGRRCSSCDRRCEPGDLYCIRCGAALGPSRRFAATAAKSAWILGGIVGVLGVGAVAFLVVDSNGGGRDVALEPPPAAGALGPTSTVDLSSMTPREAATRLFNRVMAAWETDNREEATTFLPMAIAAYARIADLTLDDRFHLSTLHAVNQDGESALAVAEAGLALRPTHLLCLAAAAKGALLTGDSDRATEYYARLEEVYEEERRAGLEEYGAGANGHADLLPVLLEDAREHLAGAPGSP